MHATETAARFGNTASAHHPSGASSTLLGFHDRLPVDPECHADRIAPTSVLLDDADGRNVSDSVRVGGRQRWVVRRRGPVPEPRCAVDAKAAKPMRDYRSSKSAALRCRAFAILSKWRI